jgi:hypothetical protein
MIQYLAQVAENHSALLTYGPLGCFCAWLMWRAERVEAKITEKVGDKISDLAHRIDGLTRAMLVDMAERETTGRNTKQYARDAIAKIDAREKKADAGTD